MEEIKFKKNITNMGNSKAIIIPSVAIKTLDLEIGEAVEITIKKNK